MNIAVTLLFDGFAVAVLAPSLLVGLTRDGIAPRLGLVAWLATVVVVLGSWIAAAGFGVAELVRDAGQPGQLILRTCMGQLRAVAVGQRGLVIQVGLWALAGLVTAAVGIAAWRLGRALYRGWVASGEHARSARLAGRRVDGLDAVVLEAAHPAAYCVAGRAPTIVVTSGALAALQPPQLAAVLSHERAHLAGRHHLMLAITRSLARLAPRVPLFPIAAEQVARLVEMCADDSAARTHSRTTVLDALLALCAIGQPRPPRAALTAGLPEAAVGASGVAVLARARRLATPADQRHRLRVRLLLASVALLVTIGPAITALLTAAGLTTCGPMTTS